MGKDVLEKSFDPRNPVLDFIESPDKTVSQLLEMRHLTV